MSRRGRILARVGLVFFSLLAALVGAELVFRATLEPPPGGGGDDEWTLRYRRMNETIYMRAEAEELIYEPRPSSSIEMEYGVAGFDSRRRRWDGSERDRSEERVEVALVGDSIAWSEFVAHADSLAARTEEALGAERYRVSSFGVSGYDTAQEAVYYPLRVRPARPDVVVVVYCLNDLFIASGPYGRFATEAEAERRHAQDAMFDSVARVRRETLDGVAMYEESQATFKLLARLQSLWRRAAFERRYVDEYTIAMGQPARVEAMRADLRRLGAAIRSDSATAVLVISPMLESWSDYHWSAQHEAVRAAAEAAGFSVHDPLDGWRRAGEDPVSLRSPGDNLHYSVEGNRAFGAAVADAIRSAMVD